MAISACEHAFFERFGARIAELRKRQNITQVEMAKTLGVSQQAVNSYDVGRRGTCRSRRSPPHTLVVKELLGEESATAAKKRGAAPKLQQQMERIQHLYRALAGGVRVPHRVESRGVCGRRRAGYDVATCHFDGAD
jgi:hypothetical protein